MKFELFNNEPNKIWKDVAIYPQVNHLQFELDICKKLLNFFQTGVYYYLIFNLNLFDFEFVSPAVTTLLGYDPSEFAMPLFMESIHPEDKPWLLIYETAALGFLAALPLHQLTKYTVQYNFRLRHKNGGYIHLLHQSAVIEYDAQGNITRTLTVHTDITHLKKECRPQLCYIGKDEEPSFIDVDVNKRPAKNKELLSRREKEILMLLIEGKLSKQIGGLLNISKNTVDNHRRNMLIKCEVGNTSELIGKAIKNGWI